MHALLVCGFYNKGYLLYGETESAPLSPDVLFLQPAPISEISSECEVMEPWS